MRCPKCSNENAAEMKFCGECGNRLTVLCPQCGTHNAPSQKFCGECGARLGLEASSPQFSSPDAYTPKHLVEKILTSKTALEGERKHVTVLFADLKGSMELIADRDPEEARKLLDPVLERMMAAVHHYEGTVNQVMGDGIMALFGAPIAHEDHAARACFASLRMQEEVGRYADKLRDAKGMDVRIRVGVNSGDVIVRSIGNDLRMDYTAVGQTTHLAARMEQMATPGTIRLSRGTLHLVEGLVDVTPLGSVTVKGLGGPIEVFELLGAGVARTRLEAAERRGLSRFVGRSAEMAQIHDALDRARLGCGQVVAVVGEPGVGKSRLFWEITHSSLATGWRVLKAGSVSYGKATSYLPVIDLLKGYFGVEDRDDLHEIRENVTGTVLTWDQSLQTAVSPLLALLGVPVDDAQWKGIDPRQRRRRTLDALKQVFLREAREQPLLVIFEDLHWIDGETQALLDALVESLPAARLVLLVNYRPEYNHAWGSKTYYRQLRIDPLPPEGADELLAALVGTDPALASLKELLITRTEANPLFLEESVRSLVETGALVGKPGDYRLTRPIEQLEIPATVQTILAARIDRLIPEAKRLLQAAAVIGKDVALPLLIAIADVPEHEVRAELSHLQAAEFLYETRLYPDLEYTFKHALTLEVAYQGLLHDRKRDLHARITNVIEHLSSERLAEQAERLAYHAQRGELWEKAVSYLRQAGLKAAAHSSLPGARARFELALDAVETLPDSRTKTEQAFDIRLELRPVLVQLGEVRQALERLLEAEILAKRLTDDRRLGRAYAILTNIHTLLGELDEAVASGTRALKIAERFGDLRLRIVATSGLVQAHNFRGEHNQAVVLATENISVLPADWIFENFGMGAPPSVYDRSQLTLSLAAVGRFAEATVPAAQAIRLASATQHPYTVGLAQHAVGTFHLLRGDWESARRHLEEAMIVVRTGQVALLFPFLVVSLALVLARLGETSEALGRLREGEQLLARQAEGGIVIFSGMLYVQLAEAALVAGEIGEAQRLGERAVVETSHQPGFTARALHILGDIATHPDRLDAIRGEEHYQKALTLAELHGMRPVVAHCHLGVGKLHRCRGDGEQAKKHLATAIAMYREMGMTYWLEPAEADLRRLD
jgi:class 3 adenylate cyclase/tetratricopeptide (TPR) repeat protein